MKPKQDYQDFHFVIDEQLKAELLQLRVFKNVTGFSGTVIKILRLMYPRLEKEHFRCVDRSSCYQQVSDDKSSQRCHVHVYLPKALYRRLKLIHQDLNFYSIAQCLRWIIRIFLNLVSRYSVNLKQHMAVRVNQWKKQNATQLVSNKDIRQLFFYFKSHQKKIHLLSVYQHDFSPVGVYLCY